MPDIQLALQLQVQGHIEEAKKIYLEFLQKNPKQPDVSNLLGLIYLQTSAFDLAEKYFKHAVEGFECAEYLQNLGLTYFNQQNYSKAMLLFEKAIEFEPQNTEFIKNFYQLAKTAKQKDFEYKFLEKILNSNPQDHIAWNNLGLLLEEQKNLPKAKEAYKKSLQINENYEAYHNLGVLYRMERDLEKSKNYLKKALKLNPKSEITNLALGMTYLTQRNFSKGYKHYMLKKPEVRAKYKNHWDGKAYPSKTLLVYYDSGFGDQIMFCRYLNIVQKMFKTVKLFTVPQLKTLFEKNFPKIEVTLSNDNNYDFSENIMYLNYKLGLDFNNIPQAEGYLSAIQTNDETFNTSDKKIGLCWQGNYNGYSNRAIPLKELMPILNIPDCQFYSFVKEDKEHQIEKFPQITNIGENLTDFYDTACKLKNLDLFITIDTAVANLAGALGINTYLLLPYASEWRWFEETQKTDWYKSIKIFKQEKPQDWQSVIKKIKKELKK